MERTPPKPSIGAMCLALIILVFGTPMTTCGYLGLQDWSSQRVVLTACGLMWLIAGPAMIGSALWVLGSLGRNRLPLRIAGAAVALSGTVLVAGGLAGILQCSTPT
jgi:hypothetical protein